MIYILSGDIRTGKTTALSNWIEARDDVNGILCPDGVDGKRYFLNIKTNDTFPLEANLQNESELITIGPFQFLKSAFKKANTYLISLASEMNSQYIIIDELGKLELKNQGLHQAAESLIPEFTFKDDQHLILVVRISLLDEIIKHYNMSHYSILNKEDLARLN